MPTHDLTTHHTPITDLRPHPDNPRNGDTAAIAESLRMNGQYRPIVVARDGTILAGNHTYAAAMELGWSHLDVVRLEVEPGSDDARAVMLADNRTADRGWYDDGLLVGLLDELDASERGLAGTGYQPSDLDRLHERLNGDTPHAKAPSLADRFGVPPLSVLRKAAGPWQERKRHWMDAHLRSHLGRAEKLTFQSARAHPDYYRDKASRERRLGRKLDAAEWDAMWERERDPLDSLGSGTSTFDPVLCELAYRWFGMPGGTVLDPCAGGSVRGLVASVCGMTYTGIDLRPEQVQANEVQAAEWDGGPMPTWLVGDSTTDEAYPDGPFDLAFTCPPYHDLERYSDDPHDLSAMSWDEFREAHRAMIGLTVDRLADERFAVWVISDVRDRRGVYRGLVADTIAAFEEVGCGLYNDVILAEPIGSASMAAGRILTLSRKVTRTHQHVLVAVKGDPKAAHAALGPVPELAMADVEPDDYGDDGEVPL